MCGRYVLEFDHDLYVGDRKVGTDIYNYNVAPTSTVPILVERVVQETLFTRELHTARWGLLPGWAKDASFSARAFNARSETIFEKPTFRHAAVNGHCAVPVSGYYEWKTETLSSGKTQKTPYFIYRKDRKPIYFAGLYEWWKVTEAEAVKEKSPYAGKMGEWVLSCSIITMDSPDEWAVAELGESGLDESTTLKLSQLHDRLPVPLTFNGTEDDGVSTWLRSGKIAGETNLPSSGMVTVSARESLNELMDQAYAQTTEWTMHPVSNAVGNVRNNGPQLIEPAEDLLSGIL